MSAPYDFAQWQELSHRREQVMQAFAPFRQGFFAELQQFIEAAAAAGVYGMSPLQPVEGYAGLFRFAFGPFKFIVVSNNTVLEAFEGANRLRARIALYYHTHDVNQPPVFIVEFGEGSEGMVCDIGRTATGEWHDVAEFTVAAPATDGARAARAVGQVIAATPAAWRRNLPWPLLAEEQQEVIELANPLGFQPNRDR
jgi:hypothetical protein